MSDVISMRLDAIAAHLRRVTDFTDLDDKRLKGLQSLREALREGRECPDGSRTESIEQAVWVTKDKVTDARRSVNTALSLKTTLARADAPEAVRLRACQEQGNLLQSAHTDLREAEVKLQALETMVADAVASVDRSLEQRLQVESEGSQVATKAFSEKAEQIAQSLDKVRELVRGAEDEEQGGSPTAGVSWSKAWKLYYRQVHAETQKLFRDYVDFLRGLATRDVLLDLSYCLLADKLIQAWSKEVSLTIPAMQEALQDTVARIVRLGFRDWSIWALPLVAREVGFAVNSEGKRSEELGRIIEEQSAQGHSDMCLRDCVADMFATCAMGPAYCFAAVYFRLDPFSAGSPAGDHSPDTERAEVIFATLEWMSRQTGEDLYGPTVRGLRKKWERVLAQAGQQDTLAPERQAQLRQLVESLAEVVWRTAYSMFSAQSWSQAERLRDEFERVASGPARLESESVKPNEQDALTAVLNGAWLARWQTPPKEAKIADLAMEAFRYLAKLPPGKPLAAEQPGRQPGGPSGPAHI